MRIGSYECDQEVGHGGAGVVYRARARDGRVVAVKLLRARTGLALKQFERESRLGHALGETQGFVPVLDHGLHGDAPFIVFPFLEGGTLRDRLRRGPLSVRSAVAIARAVARSLGAAHARGIVHRDLKPENILFGRDGAPLVADLGLAKHFDREVAGATRSVALTGYGAIKGTAGYMPAEQMSDATAAGPPADVFALGCILYECLSGEPAFAGGTIIEMVQKIEVGAFVPLASRRPEVKHALAACVERALARDPADRYQDGVAFERALFEASRPRAARRAIGVALAVVVALAALLVAAGVAAWRRPSTGGSGGDGSSSSVVSSSAPRSRAQEIFARAYAHHARGERPRAMEEAELALAADPRLGSAQALRALIVPTLQEESSGLALARDAVLRDPTSALAWSALAFTSPDDSPEIGASADKAVALDERSAIAHLARSRAHFVRKDLARALDETSRAIELEPNLAMGWRCRGQLRAIQKDPGYYEDLERSLVLAPTDAYGTFFCAVNYTLVGELGRAHELLDRVLILEPRRVNALCQRAGLACHMGNFRAADGDASRAIRISPRRAWAWALRSLARAELKDFERAASDAGRALALPRERDEAGLALQARALARTSWRDFRGAHEDMKRCAEIEPKGSNGAAARAWLEAHPRADQAPPVDRAESSEVLRTAGQALEVGQVDEGERLVELVIRSTPESAAAWAMRAIVRARRAAREESIADATQALDLDPCQLDALEARSHMFLQVGDLERAAADAEAYVTLAPSRAEGWGIRGDVRLRLRDLVGSVSDLAAAVRICPWDPEANLHLAASLDGTGDSASARVLMERAIELDSLRTAGGGRTSTVMQWAKDWLANNSRR